MEASRLRKFKIRKDTSGCEQRSLLSDAYQHAYPMNHYWLGMTPDGPAIDSIHGQTLIMIIYSGTQGERTHILNSGWSSMNNDGYERNEK